MRALVLVGGQGTRLRPLTYDVPKPMLPVAGRPMIAHTIEWLARHGIEEVVFSLGYRPDAFQAAFPDAMWAGARLTYAIEPEPLDTAGAIRFAAESAEAIDERLIVVNGDILTDLDLSELLDFHERCGGEGTIALTPVADPSAYGVVPVDDRGRVEAFIEKPPPGTELTNAINAGTYLLEPAALKRIAVERRVSIEREIFPAMVQDGALFARADDAYWIDTGTPQHYLAAEFDVLSGARQIPIALPESEEVAPMVHRCPGAGLHGTVRAPSLIGPAAVVALGASIERCVLGARVVVEENASVRNCVILDDTVVRSGARLEDSIVGAGSTIGANASVSGTSIVGFGVEVEAGASLDCARVPV